MLRALSIFEVVWTPMLANIRHYPYHNLFHQYLQNLPATNYTKLDNGLTIATEERNSCNTCVGLFIDGGSRYEESFELGIANFFEHLVYKGTHTNSRPDLEEYMSCTGAQFKSFTTREMVGYYVDCLAYDVSSAMDILSECIFHNGLDPNEIEFQKNIVHMEMQKNDSDMNLLVDEYLHATAFQGTSLANTVHGASYNLHSFNREVIRRFLYKNFHPCYSVLAVVGPIKHDHIVNFALKCSSMCETRTISCRPDGKYRYSGSEVRYRNDEIPLCNVAIAVEGPSFWNEDSIVMDLAASITGGWDKSQPWGKDNANLLAQSASEDKLCESFKSFNISYKDTGLWGLQFLGRSLDLEGMLYNIQNEWMRLCTIITDNEIDRAKNELKTKILSKTESAVGNCLDIARWTLYKGYKPSLHDRLTSIDRISAEDIKRVCTHYIYNKCPVVAAVGPCEGLPEYNRIRSSMYWLRL